jgi:hypothetical protein
MNETVITKKVSSVVTGLIVLWAGWVSAMIVAHGVVISELKTWKENRPPFATVDQVSSAILRAQTEAQDRVSSKLDSILDKVTGIDKRMSEHIARQTP